MPSFSAWIRDLQIRSAAESLQSGLLQARSEAMRRNRLVKITLENTDGLLAWTVGCVSIAPECPAAIVRRSSDKGGRNARMAAAEARKDGSSSGSLGTALAPGSGLPASIVFDGLGAVVGAAASRIDISHAAPGGARRLVLLIGGDGSVRLCSPAVASPAKPQDCA
jgi:type IV fimbrial biogenesis protein FimT